MNGHTADIRKSLDENVFLLKVLNLEFRQNLEMDIDPGFNPYLERHEDRLLVSLYKSYMTHADGSYHFVGNI